MPRVEIVCRISMAAGLALALGCGSRGSPLATVHGKVSYKGALVRSGTVVFTPDRQRGTSGPLAQADIQADGTFALQTGGVPGAVPGWHRVTVVAVEAPPAPRPGDAFAVPRALLPERYCDPELSGLTCEVKGQKENRIDLNLEAADGAPAF